MEWTKLIDVLLWLIGGGGSGVAAYALWNLLEQEFPKLAEIAPRHKRYICLGISVAFGVGAYFIQGAFSYSPWPVGAQAWAEQIFSVVALAVLASQAIHGGRKLAA